MPLPGIGFFVMGFFAFLTTFFFDFGMTISLWPHRGRLWLWLWLWLCLSRHWPATAIP